MNVLKDLPAVDIIHQYYPPDSTALHVLLLHGRQVVEKALPVARKVPHLQPDLDFIREADTLHDIGIIKTHAPALGCRGRAPYICHGILGRAMLERHGLHRHALVCERHTGVGLTIADIDRGRLPIPRRNMEPVSTEEIIICYADKFFSKDPEKQDKKRRVKNNLKSLSRFEDEKAAKFKERMVLFQDV